MKQTLLIIQIISSILLILFILLQSKGSGLGSAFGGEGSFYRSKRGVEKILHRGTILLAVIFSLSTILSVAIR